MTVLGDSSSESIVAAMAATVAALGAGSSTRVGAESSSLASSVTVPSVLLSKRCGGRIGAAGTRSGALWSRSFAGAQPPDGVLEVPGTWVGGASAGVRSFDGDQPPDGVLELVGTWVGGASAGVSSFDGDQPPDGVFAEVGTYVPIGTFGSVDAAAVAFATGSTPLAGVTERVAGAVAPMPLAGVTERIAGAVAPMPLAGVAERVAGAVAPMPLAGVTSFAGVAVRSRLVDAALAATFEGAPTPFAGVAALGRSVDETTLGVGVAVPSVSLVDVRFPIGLPIGAVIVRDGDGVVAAAAAALAAAGDDFDGAICATGDDFDEAFCAPGDDFDEVVCATGDDLDGAICATGDDFDGVVCAPGDDFDGVVCAPGVDVDFGEVDPPDDCLAAAATVLAAVTTGID